MVPSALSSAAETSRQDARAGNRSPQPMTPRNLTEFGALTHPEQQLLAALDSDFYHKCGDGGLPAEGDEACAIRASLLRLILLGGPDAPRLHEKGLRLRGAWVTGTLDLHGCRVLRDIALADCRFAAPINLQSAAVDTVLLDGSVLPGLIARRLESRGGITLRAVEIGGTIDMRGARLEGELILDGSSVTKDTDVALDVSYATIRGDLTLRGCRFRGVVKVSGARLTGDLSLVGALIDGDASVALAADGVTVGGDVVLHETRIIGEASLIGTRVSGDLRIESGAFEARGARALTLNRMRIEGALFLRHEAKVDGALGLNGAYAGAIVDEPTSWPKYGDLLLNRFRYGGFVGSPVDAPTRLDWLSRQDPERWGEDFWPQPYEQLSAVLGEMGHQEAARTILFEKERLQRLARRARAKGPMQRAVLSLRDFLLSVTVGYGLHPLRSFLWLLLFWLAGVAMLTAVQAQKQLRPNISVYMRSPEWVLCGTPATEERSLPSLNQRRPGLAVSGQAQIDCFLQQPEAQSFPKFNAWIYSLEAVIPGLETGQRDYWSPDTRFDLGFASKLFEYLQRIAGLVLGLLAFAGFSGLVKSK